MRVLKRLVSVLLASSVVLLVLSVSIYIRVTSQADKTENLIEQLQSFDWNQRRQAAEALSRTGDDHAIMPLVDALKDDDSDVRQQAAEALDRLDWQPKNETEQLLYFIAKKDWDKCVELNGGTMKMLTSVLVDKNPQVRKKAAEALGQIENPAIKPLVAALRDDNNKVRDKAADALVEIGGAYVIQSFIAALKDERFYIREKAAEALGRIGDNCATEALVAALSDINWEVREKAAEALRQMGDDHAVEPLVDALKDDDSNVRQRAAEALDGLGWQPKNKTEQHFYLIAKKDWDKFLELNGMTVEALRSMLKDRNPQVQEKAAETLIKIGGLRAIGPLIVILEHNNSDIRIKAAETLGKIEDSRAVKPLIAALRDVDPDVRKAAVEALAKIGGLHTIELLTAALKDRNSTVREAAAEILGKISNPVLKPLIAALWDENWEVREEAAKTLGKLRDSQAVDPLIAVLKYENGRVRQKTEEDLYEIAIHMFEPSIAPSINQENRLYIEVIKALGQIGDEKAISALVGELQSWDTAQAAAEALDRLNWSPQSNKDKVHFLIAKKDGNTLREIWDQTKSVLLKDMNSKEDTIVKNALYAFVAIGKQEIIKELIDTLNTKEDKAIAKVYRNCGNEKLSNAAQNWTGKHQVYISIDSGHHLVRWASW